MKKILLYDTTLRDGEQAPGNTMNPKDKLSIALKLEEMSIDIIEAGFPASSKKDFEAVKLISSKIKKTTICAFSRCVEKDIDISYEAIKGAKNKMILIFFAVSDIHLEKKYRINRKDALKKMRDSIRYAKKYFKKVYFGLEDSSRANPKFLKKVIDLLLEEKVWAVGLSDTVGYFTPFETYDSVKKIVKQVNGKSKVSIHCHNDLGMATANTLAAIFAGADIVETTINGLGERAGNASFEEIVASLFVRKDFFKQSLKIKMNKIMPISEHVYKIIGRKPSHEKPVVGVNSFRHEAGIHIDGLKKDLSTYEILNPEIIGRKREFVKGRHSGKSDKIK